MLPSSGPIDARVVVPGSKSETNRALVLAGLAYSISTIGGGLAARDSALMIGGLRALGVGIDDQNPDRWVIVPPERLRAPEGPIDVGLAGTVLRFLPAMALFADGPVAFVGDERASDRPLRPLLDGLEQLGARVESETGSVPLTITPPAELGGPEVVVDASASSQLISGLLLIGALLPHGLRLRHEGPTLPSQPHIAMTVECLRARGVRVDEEGGASWVVHPGPIAALDTQIDPDLTNAAAFLAAGVLTRGRVGVPGWPAETTQAGALILGVLERMGAHTECDGSGTQWATADRRLSGIDVDLHEGSELTPVVAALAAFADGVTRIRGVGHIRNHETDRIAALIEQFSALGLSVREDADGLDIEGAEPATLHPALLQGYGDHRLAHSAALLGLLVPGVELDDIGVVAKTMPDFPDRWAAMLRGRR